MPFVGTWPFRSRIPRENAIFAGLVSPDGQSLVESHVTGDDGYSKSYERYDASLADKIEAVLPAARGQVIVITGPGLRTLANEVEKDEWIRQRGIKVMVNETQPDRDVFIVAGLTKPIESIEDLNPAHMARLTVGHQGHEVGATNWKDHYAHGRDASEFSGVRLKDLKPGDLK